MASILLVACDSPKESSEVKQGQVPNAFETQLEAMEKAKAVEDTIQEAVIEREKALKDAGI
jgi:hypothetical protein